MYVSMCVCVCSTPRFPLWRCGRTPTNFIFQKLGHSDAHRDSKRAQFFPSRSQR